MKYDKTPYVGAAGLLGSLTLADAHLFLSAMLSLASVGYVVTKWIILVKSKKPPVE